MKIHKSRSPIQWPSIVITFLLIHITVSLSAQLSPQIEKALDDYNKELVKVYQYAEKESASVAIDRIDQLMPQLEKKAKALVALVNSDAEALEILDADDSYLMFREKPYFKEMMRIMQSEGFREKLEMNPELINKIEEAESILESYDEAELAEDIQDVGAETGTAYTMSISGSDFEGDYEIVTDFDQHAVAYIDDLGYLRFDIQGDAEGESIVSFFVENKGVGRQDWATDGHFMFEQINNDGDFEFSLWGSEGMGYIEIASIDGPGDFVSGSIRGTCQLATDDQEEEVELSAEFRVRWIENEY